MRRQITSFSLILCGLCFIFGGLVSLTSAPVASAKPLLAPSPRPPVERPTSTGSGSDRDRGSRGSHESAPATGRITGTIIDAATGAPAAGVTVSVGGVTVTSDANGNYDKWLPAGTYAVGLMLVGQGSDLQGPQEVEVRAGETTVQHLYFRSALAPTATPETLAAPTATAPALPIDSLPDTGVAAPAQPALRPTHLPRTSVPADGSLLWLSLGVSLVVVGTLVGWSGRRASRRTAARPTAPAAANADVGDPLLAALLAAHADEALLRELLDEPRR